MQAVCRLDLNDPHTAAWGIAEQGAQQSRCRLP